MLNSGYKYQAIYKYMLLNSGYKYKAIYKYAEQSGCKYQAIYKYAEQWLQIPSHLQICWTLAVNNKPFTNMLNSDCKYQSIYKI